MNCYSPSEFSILLDILAKTHKVAICTTLCSHGRQTATVWGRRWFWRIWCRRLFWLVLFWKNQGTDGLLDWDPTAEDPDSALWLENWDTENVDDEFTNYLRFLPILLWILARLFTWNSLLELNWKRRRRQRTSNKRHNHCASELKNPLKCFSLNRNRC